MNTSLNYMKFSAEVLDICIQHKLSATDIELYIYYSLNCNRFTGDTHAKSDTEIAADLQCSRTSVMRARARLEDVRLIQPTQHTRNLKNTYKLPHIAKIDAKAEQQAKKNRQKQRQITYAREKTNIENVLCRRLTHPEIKNLKRKHELEV